MPSSDSRYRWDCWGWRDEHGAGVGGDGVEHGLQREIHAGLRVIDLVDDRAGHFGVEAVHGVGRLEQQDFLAVIHVGIDEDLDGLVGAVGEEELLGRDVEVLAAMACLASRYSG